LERQIMNEDINRDPKIEEVWRSYLTTGKPPKSANLPWFESPAMRSVARRMPTDPRCQDCYYPFGGLGGNINIAVLGDNVNIASRLAGQAEAGQIAISDVTIRKAGLDSVGLEFRNLALKGKEDPVDAWIDRAGAE
jgi:hypothetical protein